MKANDILKDHRQHFIKRLISRNPLLKCTPNTYRGDLTELVKIGLEFEKNIKITSSLDVLQNLLASKPKKVEIFNAHKKNLARYTKIKNEADDYFHSTGQLSFYLGYPFIAISDPESNKYYLSPLFLWAISCKVTASSIIFDRVRDEENIVLEPHLNRILQVWLAHEKNVHLQWENAEELTWANISAETQAALATWTKCASDLDQTEVHPIPSKDEFKTFIKPRVISSAIIGYMPIKGQALLDDLDKLEELFNANLNDSQILNYFLSPRQLSTKQPVTHPDENDKWLVTDSDHSQESVLWNTRKFDLMVLQGPPGTGKSQVIVNLIADALARQKKVLVVCQKKAALEVLKKRLTANGLGELLQLIDDVQKDRMRLIKSIRDIELNSLAIKGFSQIDVERRTTSEILKNCEDYLDKSNQFLTNTDQGQRLTYGNLKAKLHQLNQKGINVYEYLRLTYQHCRQNALLPDNKDDLKELINETREFIKHYQACHYQENPWIHLQNPPTHVVEIKILLNRLVSLSHDLENKNAYFYSANLAWLAEHRWADTYYPNFLSGDYHQTYKNFKQLSVDTKKLKNWLTIQYVDTVLTAIHTGKAIEHYQQLLKFSGYIEHILHIQDKLKHLEVFDFLLKNSANQLLAWPEIIECFSIQAWLDDLISQHSVSKISFEQQKSKLATVVEQKRKKDIEHILAKFSNRVSARNKLQNMDLLRLRKSARTTKTSLRKLYTVGFEELHEIYPVLLTNPETVSSVLDLKVNLYDLVIIDEASQMFMADALPLLYRSKAAFISGDTQQMPPSDFFMSLGDDTNTDDVVEEDDVSAADKNRLIAAEGEYCLLEAAEYSVQKGNPNHSMLSVHYRSEFKELIDFSNHAFYDGKLIAASSNKKLPDIIKAPIEVNKVENAQAKLGANDVEAFEVVKRIKEIWQQQNALSLGVITLNVKQKDIIDDLLFEEAQLNPQFANRLEEERNRTKDGEDIGFFVRSVEHVQGDERDIIILSTVYDGVRKNFGAITKKEKGRKRLNVAITRAKLGMIIYSSLNIDGISNDNQREDSENYWFWKYMCYARAISLGDKKAAQLILLSLNAKFQQSATGSEPDSYFEEDVAEFLREHGFHVDYQIGESGFRIDLGVKNDVGNRLYICGIECDGRQYHSSWSARLNDIWRQKILENKGWHIIRIWSNEWFDNRKETQKKLLTDISSLV
ncbi:hypothetical protein METHB2_650017 [Candidatus Methylobacter favarea]|uniref:RAP domain-containing protein n=1 Tax=Candidatus Methylobacter favarea TaxID=2707345 RepID=A0A8S0Y6W1_9GAMM|nr:AAA domain-containing protein [Candidatus Methylobacter favarea]CAA9892329.1 hypothetical protein METHB2_650017 [Candidatus Methylobacter favarea]